MGLTKAATKLSNELHSATTFGRLKPSGTAWLEQRESAELAKSGYRSARGRGMSDTQKSSLKLLRGPKFVKIAALHVSEYRQRRTQPHSFPRIRWIALWKDQGWRLKCGRFF